MPLMILVAGPYRSGTGDDPVLIARNVAAMSDNALQLFRAGHLPVLGEWFALPLIEHAGSRQVGDAVFDEIFHPVARRLVAQCDACLRIGGASDGADEMVALARAHGKAVYFDIGDLPPATMPAAEAAIRAARAEQTRALASGDLDAVARFWTPDVSIRRALGHAVQGAEAARRMLEPGAGPPLIYQRVAVAVDVSPHWPLAWEEGRWAAHPGTVAAAPVMSGRYGAQWVQREGRWLIRAEVFVALQGEGAGLQAQALP